MATSKAPAERAGTPRLKTPTDISNSGSRQIAEALNGVLADTFALYLKTKNFHWHVSGPHFRDYHLLFEEQADALLASTDELAERVRKIGQNTLRSIGDISRQQSIEDNDKDYVDPQQMLNELREDNQRCVEAMREAHELCDEHKDAASASLLENFIDAGEKRIWFLYEAARTSGKAGH